MADIQSEKVVFEIDVSSYLEQLRVLNVQIQQAKENQKELFEAAAKGDKQAGIQLQEVNAFLKIQQKEYQGVQRALVGFTTSQKDAADTVNFANNSIKTNRALLSQLTEQYNGLKKPGAELTNTIKRLSDTLKDQEKAIGDTRRNVGNYKQDILSALSGIKGIGGAVDPIMNLGSAFSSAGGGVKGFGAALSGLGLPLIITGINLLIDAFSSFKPLVEAVQDTTDALGSSFNALVSGASIGGAVSATKEYREALRDLDDTQAGFNLQQQAYLNQIDQLIIKSKDRTKTENERKEAIKSASQIEEQALRESTARIDREFDALSSKVVKVGNIRERELNDFIFGTEEQIKYYDNQFKFNKAIDEKDLKRLQELALEKSKLVGASQTLQERLKTRENALDDEITQQQEKATQKRNEELKKRVEQQAAYNKNLEKLEDEFLLNERERLAKSFDEKIKTITGQSEREKQLRLLIEQEKQLALDKFDKDAEDKRQKRIADRLVQQQKENEAALKQLRDNAILQLELQTITGLSQQQIDAEFEKQLLNDRFLTFKDFYDNLKKLYESDAKAKEQQLKRDQELNKARIEAAGTLGGALIGFIGDIAEATGANAAFQKALAIFDIGVKTAVALAGAIQQAQSVPFPANIAAIATGIAAVLGGIGGAIATLSKAGDAPKPPKFAEGGAIDIDGKPHSQGGTPIHVNGRQVAEAEKGEKLFILKKTASQQINALSAFNQMFGGRSLTGSPVRFAAEGGSIDLSPATRSGDGGFFSRSVKTNNEMAQLSRAVMEGVRNMPAPVVSVKEINRVQSSKDRSVKVSELG